MYDSYADMADDDLTQDAIELRDRWLRLTAALAALAAPAEAAPCPACRGKGRIQSGTGPDGYQSRTCAHCQPEADA